MWPVDVEKDTSVSICTLWKEEGDFVSRRMMLNPVVSNLPILHIFIVYGERDVVGSHIRNNSSSFCLTMPPPASFPFCRA